MHCQPRLVLHLSLCNLCRVSNKWQPHYLSPVALGLAMVQNTCLDTCFICSNRVLDLPGFPFVEKSSRFHRHANLLLLLWHSVLFIMRIFFANQGVLSTRTKVCISRLWEEALGGLKMTSPLNTFHLLCSSASGERTSVTPISSFQHFPAWQNGTPTHTYARSFICILPKYQCGRTWLGPVE